MVLSAYLVLNRKLRLKQLVLWCIYISGKVRHRMICNVISKKKREIIIVPHFLHIISIRHDPMLVIRVVDYNNTVSYMSQLVTLGLFHLSHT